MFGGEGGTEGGFYNEAQIDVQFYLHSYYRRPVETYMQFLLSFFGVDINFMWIGVTVSHVWVTPTDTLSCD